MSATVLSAKALVTSQEKRPSINDAPADVPRLPLVPPGEPAGAYPETPHLPGPDPDAPVPLPEPTPVPGGPEDEPQPPDAPTALP